MANCLTASPPHRLTWLAAVTLVLVLGGCSSTQRAPESDRTVDRPGDSRTVPGDSRTVPGDSRTVPGDSRTVPRSGNEEDIGANAARTALAMRGKPYRYGGFSPQGFDCSGLVHYSYARAGGALPRNTNGLWVRSRTIDRGEIRPGDLLFFHQEGKRNSHVAIYIGSNRFVHAPSGGKQVTTASLSDPYWRQHFSAARRPVL